MRKISLLCQFNWHHITIVCSNDLLRYKNSYNIVWVVLYDNIFICFQVFDGD